MEKRLDEVGPSCFIFWGAHLDEVELSSIGRQPHFESLGLILDRLCQPNSVYLSKGVYREECTRTTVKYTYHYVQNLRSMTLPVYQVKYEMFASRCISAPRVSA